MGASSEFIFKELNATVFSFHIQDGDLWMYILYNNGRVVDQFNPLADYWVRILSEEEIKRGQGNPATVTKYIPHVMPSDIEKYIVSWDQDSDEKLNVFATDELTKEEWQLIDFMKKVKTPIHLTTTEILKD